MEKLIKKYKTLIKECEKSIKWFVKTDDIEYADKIEREELYITIYEEMIRDIKKLQELIK